MKSNDRISVLMSVYNEKDEWVLSAAESILNQEYANFELIMIIDNPDRDIANIQSNLKIYKNIRIEKNDKNIGLANSLNKAATFSTGDYLARMDADDISLPRRLRTQLEYLKQNDYDMVGGGIERIDEKGNHIGFSQLPEDTFLLKKLVHYRTICFHPTWLLKRKLFDLIDGYRAFPAAQDLDFILRALDNGARISNLNDIVLKYRINDNAVSVKKSLVQRRCQRYAHRLSKQRHANNGADSFSQDEMLANISVSTMLEYLHNISNTFTQKSVRLRKKGNKFLSYSCLFLSAIVSYEQLLFIYKAFVSKIIIKLNHVDT